MKLVYRTIESHSNYEINRLAEIRNKKTGNIVRPYDDGSGYLRVKLDGCNCRLHILCAVAFIPNTDPDHYNIVNHKKGRKHDCRASQLEWVTQSDNIKHAWETGLIKRKRKKVV